MTTEDARLSSREPQDLLFLLEKTLEESLALFEPVSDKGWSHRPASGGWSVGEIAEHLVISEAILLGAARSSTLDAPPNPNAAAETSGKTELIWRTLTNRYRKVQTPEPAVPTGEADRRELLERLRTARDETIRFVEGSADRLEAGTSEHFLFGTVNAYHWLLHLALHNQRHNQQALEVIAARDFPH